MSKNTLSKTDYILQGLSCIPLIYIFYSKFLLRNIFRLSLNQSRLCLWLIIVAIAVFGFIITWHKSRNMISLFVIVFLPFDLYTFVTWQKTAQSLIVIVIVASFIASLVFLALVWNNKIGTGVRKKIIILRRLKRSILGIVTIVTFCSSFVLLALGVSSVFHTILLSPSKSATVQEKSILNNSISTVCKFDEELWVECSTSERLDALQTVANIEASYLGLPHELTIEVDVLPETKLACYNDNTHIISISIDHIENDTATANLNSVLHEARHAMQYRLCDAYDSLDAEMQSLVVFRPIMELQAELSANYIEPEENYFKYYSQHCETDARDYAEQRSDSYYSEIEKYLYGSQ